MNRIWLLWVAVAVVFTHVGLASAYDYPSCLVQRVPGAHGPVIVVADELLEGAMRSCMEKHLRAHLSPMEWSDVSFIDAPRVYARHLIESWEANFALLDIEAGSQGGSNLLGVAVALSEDTGMDEVPELRQGDDWSEVARLSAVIDRDQSIVRHLKGDIRYWKMLGQLSSSALTDDAGNVISGRSGQHFHLIRIHCAQN